MMLFLLACFGGGTEPTPTPAPTPEATPAPILKLNPSGVREVTTPENILRSQKHEDTMVRAYLDVWFEADKTTYEGLEKLLSDAGFEITGGDGASLRVHAPEGIGWERALAWLPEVRRVVNVVQTDTLPSGRTREGTEQYIQGTNIISYTWSWGEGGPRQALSGLKVPPEPLFPTGSPSQLIRCLSPIREDLLAGVSSGPGWERAILADPPTWVVVVEDYGACQARGYLVMSTVAGVDTLTVGGKKLDEASESDWWTWAGDYLASPRAEEDGSAMAAFDLLRQAPDETLGLLMDKVVSAYFQTKLYDAFHSRSPQAALAAASVAHSAPLLARAAAEDPELRAKLLGDASTSTLIQAAILGVWHAAPGDGEILKRLQSSPDPHVRELAWERTLEWSLASCLERQKQVDIKSVDALKVLYRECPQYPVRSAAFQSLAGLDRGAAGEAVAGVLGAPETRETGVAAVRQAAAIGRRDLLEGVINSRTVSEDMKRVARDLLEKQPG